MTMGGKVKSSAYRKPPTPKGIEEVEKGRLNWFDDTMFANFNTGLLEQYLDEKNREESFNVSTWTPWKIWVAIGIGTLFALINQYVGLKVGMIIAGSWYIVYLAGLAMKWSPSEINITSTASNGAAMICTGFVFTFPAIYLLAASGSLGEEFINPKTGIPEVPIAILGATLMATILSGLLGIMYFIVFRRIWLVQDPLPMPGFEATVKLLDMANSLTSGGMAQAKRSVKLAALWIGGTMTFTFLRDFPIMPNNMPEMFGGEFKNPDTGTYEWVPDERIAPMDYFFGGKYYDHGDIHQPYSDAKYTHLTVTLIPIQFGIGWFMKFKTALLIFMGTAFAWFVVIPLAVTSNVPVFDPEASKQLGTTMIYVASYQEGGIPAAWKAYDLARMMAIGVILGGGFTALIKMAPVFLSVTKDLRASKGGKGGDGRGSHIAGKGWYEWPGAHIAIMAVITVIGVWIFFSLGFASYGNYVVHSLIFAILLVATTFFLGAIAVKVMGETGTEPVSATSFIVLFLLLGVFLLMGTPTNIALVMALVGTTVFGGAISMSGDIVLDFKNGLYCGNRPYHLVKGLSTGLIFGAIVSAVSAVILSVGLAVGRLKLTAPQAHAFELIAKTIISGQVNAPVLILGIVLGVILELLIGMGTAFGLGMYLPLGIQIPMLIGGASRDVWEKYIMEPKAKRFNWDESRKTLALLDTYMMATGLMVGEALMGTIVAIWLVLPLLTGG